MSDQLTLVGLIAEPADAKKEKAKARVKVTTESAIEARIAALMEQKAKADIASQKSRSLNTEALKADENLSSLKPRAISDQKQEKNTMTDQRESKNLSRGLNQTKLVEEVTVTKTETIQSVAVDVSAEAPKVAEPEVLTVSSLNRSIKTLLEKSYPFIWVKGEISNYKLPASGHMYFTLKDATAQIRAVMFRGFSQGLKFKPEDGMEVLVRCRVTAYEPRGDYQLFCEVMEPVGYGALQIAFEKLKAKLQSEGLFDQARKRPLPAFPKRIGLITSPTGAAIRDMINVLTRRMGGGLDVTILPTSVQGDKAPGEIVRAIQLANRMGLERFDVLIIGRGGGSLEDLWSFNIEEVVRAIAASKIPTISAVGHEVDFTIADFVADLRAPTPSAAAELVVKNKADLLERINLLQRHLVQQVNKKIQLAKGRADGFAKRLIDPKRRLQDLMLRCDEWSERLLQSMMRFLQDNQVAVKFLRERLGSPERRLQLCEQKFSSLDQRLKLAIDTKVKSKETSFARLASLLNGLSPLSILGRGYSIVKKEGEIVKDAKQVKKDDLLSITLHSGEITSKVQ